MSWRSPTTRRWLTAAVFGWLLLLPTVGLLLAIRPAQAEEGASNPATATAEVSLKACTGSTPSLAPDPCLGAGEALETTDEKILKPALQVALLTALLNVVQFTLDRIAYEAAVAIASGGEGESPLFFSKEPSEAWKDFGLDIAGEAVGNLNDLVNEELDIAFDICAPGALVKFALALGIKQAYQPEAPRCDFREVLSNWEGFVTTTVETAVNPSQAVLSEFAKGLKPGQNELSASISLTISVHEKVLEAKTQKFAEQLANGGFKNVTDIVTGTVKTPSSVLSEQFNAEISAAKEEKREVAVNTVINNSHLVSQMFLQVAGVFTNTLLSTLFNRIYAGLFDIEPEPSPFDEETISLAGRDEAAERFASLITANPVTISDYNAIAEFVTCPAGGVTTRNVNNCVMDANFAAAVTRGESGEPMTVQEAIDEGLLRGDWPLIPPDDLPRNGDPLCYTYGYCYGNVVKMRKARIVPVGWEIAASRNEKSNPKTLQEIVDDFDDCNDHGTVDESTHQFCHLIDPNWVLKYPSTQCLAYVSGEILVSTISGGRNGYCADTPSCIAEDNDGSCIGGYGYCVREKNVWRFRGDECPEYYASCLSFQNTFTGESADFLVNTVNFSVCNADNAGCRWYRTNKYFDDGGTADDTTDDTYAWLPAGETFDTADHEADWQYAGSSRDTYSYTSNSGETYSYDTYTYEDRIYYNNNVTQCSNSAAGCTRLYEVGDELVLNAIGNGSFENDEDEDGVPDFWNWAAGAETYETTGGAFYGSDSIVTGTSSGITQENIALTSNAFYTFTFYTTAEDAGATATALLEFFDGDGDPIDFTGTSYDTAEDCVRATTNGPNDSYELTGSPEVDAWSRVECTFTTTADETNATVTISSTGGAVRVDGIMFEQGEAATSFTEGYNDADPVPSYLVIAPDYLGCTGAATDPAECDSYTQACTAQDAGCNLYTPEDGDPPVPAIAGVLDECPTECVGYTTYKQEATLYDDEEFPLYFIADNAVSCAAENVGCDSFTNLDAVAEGGEGIEYYTYLRACLTEEDAGANSATFFTWEGSDATGYQLMTWQLLPSDFGAADTIDYTEATGDDDDEADTAPCVHWNVSSQGGELTITCDDMAVEAELEADDACNEHNDIFEEPDCREFYDADGNIHYRRFSETVTISDDCHPYRKTVSSQADCDASSGYWTDTGECAYFGTPGESAQCPASADGCREYTGGAGRNATTAFEDTFEDGDVVGYTESAAALSEISNESVATDGHSMRLVLAAGSSVTTQETYLDLSDRDLTYDPDDTSTCDQAGQTITGAGCEIDIDGDGDTDCTVEEGDNACGTLDDELVPGKTYVLSFWAKGDVDLGVTFVEEGGTGDTHDFVDPNDGENDLDSIALSGSWQLYEAGPLDTSDFDAFDDTAVISFYNAGTAIGTAYLDNIQLKAVEEHITLIKDSWFVPATCDTSPAGTPAPQYYLGCEAYTDQDGNDGTFYQFSDLCSEEVVGCEAFYDTQNSDSEYGQAFNVRCVYDTDGNVTTEETVNSNTACQMDGETVCTISTGRSYCLFDADTALPTPLPDGIVLGPEAVVVPNDIVTYLVDDGSTACDQASMGCEEVGNPVFSQDRTRVTEFESAYYINLPDSYGDVLCDNEALFCEEWSSTQDGNFFFKDPELQTCEYQSSVTIDNQDFYGWFRTGSDEPCYWTDNDGDGIFDPDDDDAYLISGEEFGIWRNGDTAYTGWVGQCTSAHDLCTEFIDAADTGEGLYPQGTSYFFVDDELLSEETLSDSQRCNGQVSQKEGCVLFENTNNSELTYSVEPSYIVSEHADVFFGDAPLSLQDPIDCDTEGGGEITLQGTNTVVDVCLQRCRYTVGPDVDLEIGNAIEGEVAGGNEFAGACFTNEDCPVLKGDDGQDYAGICFDLTGTPNEEHARFMNDANEVLKVNRDRECAEWLYESSSQFSWNTRTNRYEIVSDDILLCSRYAVAGDQGICTRTEESDAVVLDVFEYANRDVSWNGLEYSGYAIPEQLPVEHYDGHNINPDSWCVDENERPVTPNDKYVPCNTSADCIEQGYDACAAAEDDLRLGYLAGPCDQDADGFGGACTVGFCEDSGIACSSDTDCDASEDCVIGYCQDLSTTACSSDADCTTASYPVCDPKQGVCVDQLTPNADTCVTVANCSGASPTCTPSALSKTGSCYNDKCLTDIAGEPLQQNGALSRHARPLECRGYPEATSPFTPELVETWATVQETGGLSQTVFPSDTAHLDKNSQPYTLKYGFQGVDVCAPSPVDDDGNGEPDRYEANEECVCNYDKAEYLDGAAIRYYPQATAAQDVLTGVCISGALAGYECDSDADCKTEETLGGTCARLTRKDRLYGFEGYCLEKDTSIQLFGSEDTEDRPCLTWLPVDQPAGATDLYGKFTQAGYELVDTQYCSEIDLFFDARISNYDQLKTGKDFGVQPESQTIACAEFPGKDCRENNDSCAENVSCPGGYFAIMGACAWKGNNKQNAYADVCRGGTLKDNGCPYVCIPKNSVHEADGTGWQEGDWCSPPASNVKRETGINGTVVYSYNDAEGNDFDAAVQTYIDCVNAGIKSDQPGFGISDGFGILVKNFELTELPYFACESVIQLSSASKGNKAWTNRIWESGAYIIEPYTSAYFNYIYGTNVSPFGVSLSKAQSQEFLGIDGTDYRPIPIAQCFAGGTPYLPASDALCPSAAVGGVVIGDGSASRAYHFVEVEQFSGDCHSDADCTLGITCSTPTTGVCFLPCTEGGSECADAGLGACNLNTLVCSVPLPKNNKTDCEAAGGLWFDKVCGGGPNDGELCEVVADCTAGVSCDKVDCTTDVDGDCTIVDPGVCVGTQTEAAKVVTTGTDVLPGSVKERLLQIFATSYFLQTFFDEQTNIDKADPETDIPDDGGEYGSFTDPGDFFWDVTAYGDDWDDGTPDSPVVLALGQCIGTQCEEGEADTITVNGENSGTVVGSGGSEHVVASFFAYADNNQMPIKNIIIDWGDGDWVNDTKPWPTEGSQSGSSDTEGNYYKNHRGLIPSNPTITQCDGSEWGRTSESCEGSYITFTHDYTCGNGYFDQLAVRTCEYADDGHLLNSPCVDSSIALDACIFQPRVFIKDNWGWCTGECDGAADIEEDEGCYDGEDVLGYNECDWENCPGDASDCFGADPWVYFDGYVSVTPP